MRIQQGSDIPSSEITPERIYHGRRRFMQAASIVLANTAISPLLATQAKPGPYDTNDKVTPYEDASTYNNYYEFGSDKDAPAKSAGEFRTKPWTVAVEGLVKRPAVYELD